MTIKMSAMTKMHPAGRRVKATEMVTRTRMTRMMMVRTVGRAQVKQQMRGAPSSMLMAQLTTTKTQDMAISR
jgi:hypothetical protein